MFHFQKLKFKLKLCMYAGIILIFLIGSAQLLIFDKNNKQSSDDGNATEEENLALEQYQNLIDNGDGFFGIPFEGKYRITSFFGRRNAPTPGASQNHGALDIAMPDKTPIYAAADGIVVEARMERGYGNYIKIDHGNRMYTGYAHLYYIAVREGQHIKRGELIGLSGGVAGRASSGTSTGPHLHFEIYLGGRDHAHRVDPLNYLSNVNEHLYIGFRL